MRNILTGCLILLITLTAFAQKNLTLNGNLTYSERLADIWGYTDTAGKEYALVGTLTTLSIVDISDSTNPVELFAVQGDTSIWRDIKTWKDHAYVTNESGGGLMIVDLSGLPDSVSSSNWNSGEFILKSAHNIFIDENGFAYLFGFKDEADTIDVHDRGAMILDLANPDTPVHVGTYTTYYAHDGFVLSDTLWTAEIYLGQFSAVDVTDKANPVHLGFHATPNFFTHNVWLSDDKKTLFTTDEQSGAFVTSFDVSDISNMNELHRYQSTHSSGPFPHNIHYLNNYLITSYYRDGVTIVDATRPEHLVEIGFYDTSPLTGSGTTGCWGVYPFFPSGRIVASDIDDGLFVLTPNYTRACYLEGEIIDSTTGSPVANVKVELVGAMKETRTDIAGTFKIGVPDSGIYDVRLTRIDCDTKLIIGVSLSKGLTTLLNDTLTCINLSSSTLLWDKEEVITAFPVPFIGTTKINIKGLALNRKSAYLTITDIYGKTVQHIELESKNQSIEFGHDMPSGVYFARLTNGILNYTIKLIKLN